MVSMPFIRSPLGGGGGQTNQAQRAYRYMQYIRPKKEIDVSN